MKKIDFIKYHIIITLQRSYNFVLDFNLTFLDQFTLFPLQKKKASPEASTQADSQTNECIIKIRITLV